MCKKMNAVTAVAMIVTLVVLATLGDYWLFGRLTLENWFYLNTWEVTMFVLGVLFAVCASRLKKFDKLSVSKV